MYAISASHLLQSLKLEVQHCIDLSDPSLCKYMKFAVAPVHTSSLPYQFKIVEGGEFPANSRYGSIERSKFCLFAVLGTENNGSEGNGEEDQNNGGQEQGQSNGGQSNGHEDSGDDGESGDEGGRGGKQKGSQGEEGGGGSGSGEGQQMEQQQEILQQEREHQANEPAHHQEEKEVLHKGKCCIIMFQA